MKLHRALVVVPVGGPPIADGGVLTEKGVIVEVGPFARLKGQGTVVDHEEAVLMPALVNCHSHLELSHLAALGQGPARDGDMGGWIADLLAAREQSPGIDLAAARQVLDSFHRQGVGWVLDVGNRPESMKIGEGHPVQVRFQLELLGLAQQSAEQAITRMQESACDCTGHAPYSNHVWLLQAAKARARARHQLFSIHAAESAEEIRFLRDGSGPLRRLIEQRGFWDGSFVPPGCGAISYLDRLGVLDQQTLCVHGVQVSEEEIGLLAKRRAMVCLCPASNRQLGVGRASAGKMAAAGIVIALGTDSAASNPLLSLWEEMRLLREEHPDLSPDTVLAMASLNGAQVLGLPEAGALAPGKQAAVLAVHAPGITADKAVDFLTSVGAKTQVDWAENPLVPARLQLEATLRKPRGFLGFRDGGNPGADASPRRTGRGTERSPVSKAIENEGREQKRAEGCSRAGEMTARIGMVNFINTAPLYAIWQQRVNRLDWQVTEGPPTTLNRLLSSNELDLGFVSSHEYAVRPQLYRVLADISISSTGRVGSVFLFSRLAPDSLGGEEVRLSSQSQTSVALVKIILEEFYRVMPRYLTGNEPAGAEAAAVLAIGDEALRLKAGGGYPFCLDLGEIWQQHTGLPFVFAVWAVREEFFARAPGCVSDIRCELLTCIRQGREELDAVCRQVAPRIPMSVPACQRYLSGIEYDLGPEKLKALALFYDFLIKRGEAPAAALPVKLCV